MVYSSGILRVNEVDYLNRSSDLVMGPMSKRVNCIDSLLVHLWV